MEHFHKKCNKSEIMMLTFILLICISLPTIIQAQYFAKVSKSVPRLGRRVDPGMTGAYTGEGLSKFPSLISSWFNEFDSNGDRCLSAEEFRNFLMERSKSERNGKRGENLNLDNLLAVIDDK